MNNLRIRSESMLGTTHSWAVTLRSLLREFDKLGHELCLNSTNGYDLFPEDWEGFKTEGINADIDLTYTLPRNFKYRFNRNSKKEDIKAWTKTRYDALVEEAQNQSDLQASSDNNDPILANEIS